MQDRLLLMLMLGLLSACARGTLFGHAVNDGSAASAGQAPITRFAVEFTPAAQKQAADDERFNTEALRDAISAELGARLLLAAQSGSGRAAVIQVDEFSVRATSNVVLLGYLRSAGVLAATVRIREAGVEGREFHVRAETSMNVARAGTDKNPLKKLYGDFATQLADELIGITQSRRQQP